MMDKTMKTLKKFGSKNGFHPISANSSKEKAKFTLPSHMSDGSTSHTSRNIWEGSERSEDPTVHHRISDCSLMVDSSNKDLIHEPRTSSRQRVKEKNREFSVQKLQFEKLGGKLYGRQREIDQLKSIFSNNSKRSYVTIGGESGTGKSALAAKVKPLVQRSDGFYVSGKFDLADARSNKNTEPYSALKHALDQLLQQVVDLNNQDTRYASIRESLFEDAESLQVLTQIVPKLNTLLDPDHGQVVTFQQGSTTSQLTAVLGGQQSSDRLQFAFRKLVQAVTRSCPLVVVVDDCQWADQESLDILKSWITDTEDSNCQLLILSCYRSNLVDDNHFFKQTLEELQQVSKSQGGFSIEHIEVGNLNLEAAGELLADVLNLDPTGADPLATIVHSKTLGNAFFMIQYVLSLAQDELLVFNIGSMQWSWDESKIKQETSSTNNVVDLLSAKMRRSDVANSILPAAACLGSRFGISAICIVMTALHPNLEEGAIRQMLAACVAEGFLQSMGDESYGFVHDKVQEASLALVPQEGQSMLKHNVGDALLSAIPANELNELLFTVANLMNVKTRFDDDMDRCKQMEIVNLHYQAGTAAMQMSAFEAATGYFQQANKLLPERHWITNYDLSLRIYTQGAEAAYCVGRFELMKQYCDAVLMQEDVKLQTRLQIFNLLIDTALARNEKAHAIELSYTSLRQAGVSLARHHVAVTAGMLRGLLAFTHRPQKVMAKIAELPICTDPVQVLISRGIDKLGRVGYLAGQPELLAYCCIVNVKRCFRFGIAPHTSLSVGLLAFLVTCVVGDVANGLEYGDLSLSLLDKVGDKHVECITKFTVTLFVHHWTKPYPTLIETVLEGYRTGMRCGDIESGSYCCYYTMYLSLLCSRPLGAVEDDVNNFFKQMKDFSRHLSYWYFAPLLQGIRNLRGKSQNTTLLSGDGVNDMVESELWELGEDQVQVKAAAKGFKMELATFFGEYELGTKLVMEEGENLCKLMTGLPQIISVRFCGSFCLFAKARKTGSTRLERLARKHRKALKVWAKNGNPNVAGPLLLLDAEALAFRCRRGKGKGKGKVNREKVEAEYQNAARSHGRFGLTHLQALCNERLALFYLEQGQQSDADYSFKEALKLYADWGADAKVLQLNKLISSTS